MTMNDNRMHRCMESSVAPPMFFLWICYLFISVHLMVMVDGSQKFVPNGRYGRRSDLPAMPAADSYFYETADSPVSNDVDSFVNQDGEILNVNNPKTGLMPTTDIDWSSSLLMLKQQQLHQQQLMYRCFNIEDKKLMIWCLKSLPIVKFIMVKNARPSLSSSSSSSSSSVWYPMNLLGRQEQPRPQMQQQSQEPVQSHEQSQQPQGLDQDHI